MYDKNSLGYLKNLLFFPPHGDIKRNVCNKLCDKKCSKEIYDLPDAFVDFSIQWSCLNAWYFRVAFIFGISFSISLEENVNISTSVLKKKKKYAFLVPQS